MLGIPNQGIRVDAKGEKGDVLVIKYSDVLKAMRRDTVELGADVRCTRRTRTDEMILELKRDKERKGAA